MFSLPVLLILPLAALAGNQHLQSPRHARSNVVKLRNNKQYTLTDKYAGQSFFDGWDFFTGGDPTHGNVNFVSGDEAFKSGLAFVQDDNTVVMAVDSQTKLASGANRNSVRINSKKSYNGGLFIADIFAMPHGCSVWPAWWMAGPDWPQNGEIDILEGVHNQQFNQYTLHTAAGCNTDRNPAMKFAVPGNSSKSFTAQILGTSCASGGTYGNNGCGFLDTDTRSYGRDFNDIAGGVYATLWDQSGIKIWHFARAEIPSDIDAGNPNPSAWGAPAAFWAASDCNPATHFHDHQLIFDITLCGDWAGASYEGSGCPGTCTDAVADPSNFKFAQWKINYVAVYN
ncbi:glycoside hydrolase family 16 protein [Rickenella mellea]|uniref:Glycoside hydrolase family 16 protein n=1 Tax=Rickenella mellea TaxID=50990 RepID=A0A4Y7QHH5_9AGAM|nr:glycoside hydrolase family 16 protein [Rickenella mellea]